MKILRASIYLNESTKRNLIIENINIQFWSNALTLDEFELAITLFEFDLIRLA
jgi:hypothetical protein